MPPHKCAPTTGIIRDPWPLREILVGERSRSMTRHMARLALDLARLLEGEDDPELDFIAERVREIWGVLHRGGGTLEEHSADLWDQLHGPDAREEAIEEEQQAEAQRVSERMFARLPRMSEDELVVGQARINEEYRREREEEGRRAEGERRVAEERRVLEGFEVVAPELPSRKTRGRGRSKKETATDDALKQSSITSRRGRSKKASISDVEDEAVAADDVVVPAHAIEKKRRGMSQHSNALENEAGVDENAIAPVSPLSQEHQGDSSEAHVAPVQNEDLEELHEDVESNAPAPISPAKTRGKVKDVQAPQPVTQPSASTSTTRATRNSKRKASDDNEEGNTVAPPAAKKLRRTRGDDLTINGTAAMAGKLARAPITEYQDARGKWWAAPDVTGRPDWAFAERTV